MKTILVLIALSIFPKICPANDQNGPDYEEAIKKISQIREALKLSTSQGEVCTIPTSKNCTFESYCSEFAKKGQNFYLYENKEGRKIVNFHMQMNLKLGEACVKNAFPQALVSDPFSYPELLESETKAGGKQNIKKYRSLAEKELRRAESLFVDTKEKVIQLLEKRRTSTNKSEIDNMIQRVQRTRFASPKFGDKMDSLAAQGCEMPNAFYDPNENSVTLCPQFLNLPDAALVSALAHEIGHSIDPCAMTYTYSKNGDNTLELDPPAYLGGLESTKSTPEVKAVFPDKNPLNDVIACLKSPASLGVKTPSQKEMLAAVDKMESDLRNEMNVDEENGDLGDATMAAFEDQRNTIRNSYQKYQNCSRFTNNGHAQEAFADWMAAEVIGEKISQIKNSEQARQYAFESQAIFFSTGCENIKQATANKIKNATGPNCEMFAEIMEKIKSLQAENVSTHPETAARVNRVILAKPELQKALGCKTGQNGKFCK